MVPRISRFRHNLVPSVESWGFSRESASTATPGHWQMEEALDAWKYA